MVILEYWQCMYISLEVLHGDPLPEAHMNGFQKKKMRVHEALFVLLALIQKLRPYGVGAHANQFSKRSCSDVQEKKPILIQIGICI